jgi:hypothetical protein
VRSRGQLTKWNKQTALGEDGTVNKMEQTNSIKGEDGTVNKWNKQTALRGKMVQLTNGTNKQH